VARLSLIVFSNPGDTERLRLDKEHRVIDEALSKVGYPPEAVRRLHATRIDDLSFEKPAEMQAFFVGRSHAFSLDPHSVSPE
jgi:hypothetical protein